MHFQHPLSAWVLGLKSNGTGKNKKFGVTSDQLSKQWAFPGHVYQPCTFILTTDLTPPGLEKLKCILSRSTKFVPHRGYFVIACNPMTNILWWFLVLKIQKLPTGSTKLETSVNWYEQKRFAFRKNGRRWYSYIHYLPSHWRCLYFSSTGQESYSDMSQGCHRKPGVRIQANAQALPWWIAHLFWRPEV